MGFSLRMAESITWLMTGVLIDLRAAIAAGNKGPAVALALCHPVLLGHLSEAQRATVQAWVDDYQDAAANRSVIWTGRKR